MFKTNLIYQKCSIEYYCQPFSVLVVATMCLAGHQDLSCSFFPIFFTFIFRSVNKPSSDVPSFIFAIALVRRTWVPAAGTCKVHFLTLQARVDDPTWGSRFDKEVMLRAFRLVHLQRNYNYRIKLNCLHLSAGADQPNGLVRAGTLRDLFWKRTNLGQVGENHR